MQKKQYIRGELLIKGAWTVCRFKRGLGKKEGVMFFRGGVETPMHTMSWRRLLIDTMACRHKNPKQITMCDTNIVIILLIIVIYN